MAGNEQDPTVIRDAYLTEQDLPGGRYDSSWEPTEAPREPAGGNWAIFAGVVLLLAGLGHVLIGLVALFDASNFNAAESDPALPIGYSAWGWIQLVLGAVLLGAGGALMKGKAWGRIVAIVFAVVNAIGALAFLPAAPGWALVLITLDVVIVYTLTVRYATT